MAELKEAPKPKLYNALHDKSIDAVLGEYQNIFSEGEQEKYRTERTNDRDVLYGKLVTHLAQHGVDAKTRDLKRQSYHDHKDKRKWAEDLVSHLLLHGVAKMYGAEAAKIYGDPKNRDLLREYGEKMMGKGQGSFDAIIDVFADSKNLRADFHEDSAVQNVVTQYLGNINTQTRKMREYQQHLQRPEYFDAISKFVDTLVKPHKFKVKSSATIEDLLQTIPHATNPALHPKLKEFKHLESTQQKGNVLQFPGKASPAINQQKKAA